MRLLIPYVLSAPVFCLCLFSGAAGNALASSPSQTDAVARQELLDRLHTLERDGAPTSANLDARREYADALAAVGHHDLAATAYEALAEAHANPEALWRAAAEAWMRVGPAGNEGAFEALRRVLALDADDVDARALLARLLHREGLYEQAAREYEEALQREPEHVAALLGVAALRARSGEVFESSSLIDALGGDARPFDIETRLMLRKALFDFERRGGWFEDAAPNHAAYARLLYRAGRITDALLASRRALALDDADFDTWNFLAAMQLQLGNAERALEAYEKSLAANPDQPRVVDMRAQLMRQHMPDQVEQEPE